MDPRHSTQSRQSASGWRAAVAQDDTEADVDVEFRGRLVAAARAATVLWIVEPGAAAQDARPISGTNGVLHRLFLSFLVRIGTTAVLAPLPDVAVDVVQPPGIGLELTDRGGEDEAIVALDRRQFGKALMERGVGNIPYRGQLLPVIAAAVAVVRAAGAGEELPLGLGRQVIARLLLLAQPFAEGGGIIPRDVDDRVAVGGIPRPADVLPVILRILDKLRRTLGIVAPAAVAVLLGVRHVVHVVNEGS